MTVQNIYEIALSFDATTTAQDNSLAPHVLNWLNVALLDTLHVENTLRHFEERELLTAAPMLQSMDEEVPYHDLLVRNAFPYFIASQILKDDDNNTWASRYYDMYVNAVAEASLMLPQDEFDLHTDMWR